MKVINVEREEGGDFKDYLENLAEKTVPNFDDYPFSSSTLKKHPKRQKAYDVWVESGKKQLTRFYFPDKWLREKFGSLIRLSLTLQHIDSLGGAVPRLAGLTIDETFMVKCALAEAYEMFMLEVSGSKKTIIGYDVEARYFKVLYDLTFNAPSLNINISDDSVVLKKLREGGFKGGKKTLPDKPLFQSDYRAERDSDKSRTRQSIFDALVEHYPNGVRSTLLGWAKEADKEDGFIRKRGRSSKKGS